MKRPIIILLILIYIIISIYSNYKYNKFFKNIPEEIDIQATIISEKEKGEYYNSYTIKGKNNKYKNKKFILYTKYNLEFGDEIIAYGNYIKPEEQRNYKGFNYKKYLQTQLIYGSIKSNKIEIISKNKLNYFLIVSKKIRNSIINNIKRILPKETSGLLIGFLLGDKAYLQENIVENFQKSSLAHMLAVSGTHISYIILGVSILIKKISKKTGYYLTIFILIFYLFLTNFSATVVRASVMAIILIISQMVHRKVDIINSICIALLLLIIHNPYSLNSVSVELSFLGTLGVIYLTPKINELIQSNKIFSKYPKLSKTISVPIAAQIAILPIMILNFHTISFTFLLSNIMAVPLLGIAIILGFTTVFLSFIWIGLAQKIGVLLNLVLKLIISIANICSNIKISNIYVITPSIITVLIYYLFLIATVYIYNLNKNINLTDFEKYILNIFSKISRKKNTSFFINNNCFNRISICKL